MAKKTIEELKERFKTGMFPTQSDYEDVFDSILTAVTTDDVNGVGEDREKTLTQMLESIDTSRIPDGLDDFIRNVESFLAGIEVNKTLAELLEGLKKEIEYTAGSGININDNVISANIDVLVTKSDLDRKAERSELNSIQSTVSDLESRKAERSELNSIQSTVSDLESRKAERSELNSKANVSEIPDVSNFVTSDQIPNTDEFVTRGELPNFSEFATTSQLDDKADRSELPNVSNFATTSQLDKKVDKTNFNNLEARTTNLAERVATLESKKVDKTNFNNLVERVKTLDNNKVNKSDFNSISTRVTALDNNKADKTDLDKLNKRVTTLENGSGSGSEVTREDLNNIEILLNDKASQDDLNNLETDVNNKADREDLNNLETRVAELERIVSDLQSTLEFTTI